MWLRNIEKLDALVEPILRAARIPGAAIAIVADGRTVFAKGYGYRDLEAQAPATEQTVYPIASTSKAFNATLLGMLVDEGKLAWDVPVQQYWPQFHLQDALRSTQVTLRDLLTMRTGLPRHDWLWNGNTLDRAEMMKRLRHLDLSAGFRERYQYGNLSATAAGHVAEIVTGRSWEDLVRERILEPLGMGSTTFALSAAGNVTQSYHETAHRELRPTQRLAAEATAPSGGAIHSTVEDMARWIAFNLNEGRVDGRRLIQPQTLKDIHSPQIVIPADSAAGSPHMIYALGWVLNTYHGARRIAHGGYLHDVHSQVSCFPQERIGIVVFTNFGPPMLALLITEHAFDLIMGLKPVHTVEEKLAQYEKSIESTQARNASVHRVASTAPSHSLQDHVGVYIHAGYGAIEIQRSGHGLVFHRNNLVLPLQHWHYDAWVFQSNDLFPIHQPHAFDQTSRILFETSADGEIIAFSMQLEPAVAPIRFEKQVVL